MIKTLMQSNFDTEVLNSKGLFLVDFFSPN